MPQMAPMWWTTLYMLFLASLMMGVMMMYFFNIYPALKMNIKKNEKNEENWKW